MRRIFITIISLLLCTVVFGQNCSCTKDSILSSIIICDTIKFDNQAKLFWNYNCDSSWLTFESPKHKKEILYSLGKDLEPLTGRLGLSFAQEYSQTFLIQDNVISGCCVPPDFFLYDKATGQEKKDLGRLLFYSNNRKLPFTISITGSGYDSIYTGNYDSLIIYNIDKQKEYFYKLQKGEISKALNQTVKMFPENLFDEPILKGESVILTFQLNNPKNQKDIRFKKIIIDLKKYSN